MDKLVEGGIDITALHNHLALNTANTAPIVHVRQNPARKPIETVQPRSTVALIRSVQLDASKNLANWPF